MDELLTALDRAVAKAALHLESHLPHGEYFSDEAKDELTSIGYVCLMEKLQDNPNLTPGEVAGCLHWKIVEAYQDESQTAVVPVTAESNRQRKHRRKNHPILNEVRERRPDQSENQILAEAESLAASRRRKIPVGPLYATKVVDHFCTPTLTPEQHALLSDDEPEDLISEPMGSHVRADHEEVNLLTEEIEQQREFIHLLMQQAASDKTDEDILSYWLEHLQAKPTHQQIGDAIDVSSSTVTRRLRRMKAVAIELVIELTREKEIDEIDGEE